MNRKKSCFFYHLMLHIRKIYKDQELYFHLPLRSLEQTSKTSREPHISEETHQVFDKLFLHNADNACKPAKLRALKAHNPQLLQRDTRWCSDAAIETHHFCAP